MIKETILTPEQWKESKLLYGDIITPENTHLINRSVYINRPPSSCKVIKNYDTGDYHVFSLDSSVMAVIGSKGGKVTQDKLSPLERKDKAQKAIKARWDKYRSNKQ